MLRNKIFKVAFRNGSQFYVKAVDGGALLTLLFQYGLPRPKRVERAPGHSKKALSPFQVKGAYVA